jgi:hypothetical protein
MLLIKGLQTGPLRGANAKVARRELSEAEWGSTLGVRRTRMSGGGLATFVITLTALALRFALRRVKVL